jgi:hypothetical protein
VVGGTQWWVALGGNLRYRAGRACAPLGRVPHPHRNNTSILSFSTYINSTAMAPIDTPITDLKLHEQDEDFSIRGIVKKHGVEYSLLRRR